MFFKCIFLIIIIFVLIYFIYSYNDFVSIKNNINKSWANINVLLKQRHDELTKLMDLCKQYMDYELKTFKDIIAARQGVEAAYAQNNINSLNHEEKQLGAGIKNLLAVAENYPSLQANKSFQQIGNSVRSLESRIAERRELYNASVNINNILVDQFQSNLTAKICRFKKLPLLDFSDEEKSDISISKAFDGSRYES